MAGYSPNMDILMAGLALMAFLAGLVAFLAGLVDGLAGLVIHRRRGACAHPGEFFLLINTIFFQPCDVGCRGCCPVCANGLLHGHPSWPC